jgi:glycosyltransferase involved in cell wall biosynthesis
MKTLLFIHNHPLDEAYGGSLVTRKAYYALSKMYIMKEYFITRKRNKLLKYFSYILFYSTNLSPFDILRVMRLVKKCDDIDIIYFDVSVYGILAKKIKRKYPNLEIIVNFHNNESKYHFDLFKSSGLLYILPWLSARYNENLSLKYSDLNIFITEKDRSSFGAIKTPSIIIPVTLEDKFEQLYFQKTINMDDYILFVGSAFFANLEAASFLIKKIAPYIKYKIFIVGKGMKTALSKVKIPKNVIIEDYVEDLSLIYSNALAFVAPLFLGSGMKVKLVEAMMYGKKIIASSLSFYGFNMNESCCTICDAAEDFIREINNIDISKTFYEESRQLFINYYSSLNNNMYYSQVKNYFK